MAGIVHKKVHVSGGKGLASEWNDDHEITGDVPFSAHKATGVKDPTLDQDAATKKYVDTHGLRYGASAAGVKVDETTDETISATVTIPANTFAVGIIVIACGFSHHDEDAGAEGHFRYRIKAGPAGSEVEKIYTDSYMAPTANNVGRDAWSISVYITDLTLTNDNNVILTIKPSINSAFSYGHCKQLIVIGF